MRWSRFSAVCIGLVGCATDHTRTVSLAEMPDLQLDGQCTGAPCMFIVDEVVHQDIIIGYTN